MAEIKYAGSVALQQMVDETKSRLNNKVDKVTGMGLSANDYDDAAKAIVDSVESGAQVNVLEGIVVDGTDVAISNKKSTLGKLALKDEVGTSELSSALANTISGKADAADVYTKTEANNLLDAKAPLASPALTGTPTAPTANEGDNSTAIATTAFVKNAVDGVKSDLAAAFKFKGKVNDLTELEAIADPANGDVYQVANPGTGKTNAEYAYDGAAFVELGTEINLSGYATLDSPVFTGNPTAPTPTADDNSTSIATTAYVQSELNDYAKTADLVAITAAEVTTMWAD